VIPEAFKRKLQNTPKTKRGFDFHSGSYHFSFVPFKGNALFLCQFPLIALREY